MSPAVRVYLDHNATTPPRPGVFEAMRPWLERLTANPSSSHADGRAARAALDDARARVAASLGAAPEELVFTSGGTESNNLALLGAAAVRDGRAVLTSAIEHPCVLRAAAFLEQHGVPVHRVAPAPDGTVLAAAVAAAARAAAPVGLVSLQAANHEIGTVQPLAEVARVAHEHGAWMHSDAVQALGKIPLRVRELGVDLLSVSAHKIGGPVGVGALYVRSGVRIRPQLHGGTQEGGFRAGTPPVALAVGFAAALDAAEAARDALNARHREFEQCLLEALHTRFPEVVRNGGAARRLANTINVSFPGADRDALLINLDLLGIRVSSGAACASGAPGASPVLAALGHDDSVAASSLRISFGHDTRREEIDAFLDALRVSIARARGA